MPKWSPPSLLFYCLLCVWESSVPTPPGFILDRILPPSCEHQCFCIQPNWHPLELLSLGSALCCSPPPWQWSALSLPTARRQENRNTQFRMRDLKFPILSAPLRHVRGHKGCSSPSVGEARGACVAALGCRMIPLVLEESWLGFPGDSIITGICHMVTVFRVTNCSFAFDTQWISPNFLVILPAEICWGISLGSLGDLFLLLFIKCMRK